ncbi:hypothetical protein PIB30_057126 [Stylosanthes scabra]|uniref:Uncharacterized protein n=1 Tax=Stylosanthes scabra TaxID=79078 RepID=A0ABU6RJW5_9FABA|nr:hypothetical protein [Stylosanthes scabra]
MVVEFAVNNLVLKELVEPAVTKPTAQIPLVTVVNPCRRDPTLASRDVRITVTDLAPFLPIQSYGGLAVKQPAPPFWVLSFPRCPARIVINDEDPVTLAEAIIKEVASFLSHRQFSTVKGKLLLKQRHLIPPRGCASWQCDAANLFSTIRQVHRIK